MGLPINTRYAFLAAAILCIFCGAGVFGWTELEPGDRRRRPWMALGAVVVLALLIYAPSQYRSANRNSPKLAKQERIEDDLTALVGPGAINLACGPVGVPNHAPIPLLSLYLKASPARIRSAQVRADHLRRLHGPGEHRGRTRLSVLDKRDPHEAVSVPPGFVESASNRSWLIFKRCPS